MNIKNTKFRADYKKIILKNVVTGEVHGETSYFPVLSDNPHDLVKSANQELVNILLYLYPDFEFDTVYVKTLYSSDEKGKLACWSNIQAEKFNIRCSLDGSVREAEESEGGHSQLLGKTTTIVTPSEYSFDDLEIQIIAKDGYLLTTPLLDGGAHINTNGGIFYPYHLADSSSFNSIEELIDHFGGERYLEKMNKDKVADYKDFYRIVYRKNGVINDNPREELALRLNLRFKDMYFYNK